MAALQRRGEVQERKLHWSLSLQLSVPMVFGLLCARAYGVNFKGKFRVCNFNFWVYSGSHFLEFQRNFKSYQISSVPPHTCKREETDLAGTQRTKCLLSVCFFWGITLEFENLGTNLTVPPPFPKLLVHFVGRFSCKNVPVAKEGF